VIQPFYNIQIISTLGSTPNTVCHGFSSGHLRYFPNSYSHSLTIDRTTVVVHYETEILVARKTENRVSKEVSSTYHGVPFMESSPPKT
jgi:hypothetical protein